MSSLVCDANISSRLRPTSQFSPASLCHCHTKGLYTLHQTVHILQTMFKSYAHQAGNKSWRRLNLTSFVCELYFRCTHATSGAQPSTLQQTRVPTFLRTGPIRQRRPARRGVWNAEYIALLISVTKARSGWICINTASAPFNTFTFTHFGRQFLLFQQLHTCRNYRRTPRNSDKIWPYKSSRSSKVIDLGVNRKRICDLLLVNNSNWWRISYRFRDTDA